MLDAFLSSLTSFGYKMLFKYTCILPYHRTKCGVSSIKRIFNLSIMDAFERKTLIYVNTSTSAIHIPFVEAT